MQPLKSIQPLKLNSLGVGGALPLPSAGSSMVAPKSLDAMKPKKSCGDIERDCDDEVAEIESAFEARAKEESRRFAKATDSEYWVCLCFQTREEVEEFMEKSGWGNPQEKYIDGRKVADALGIEIKKDAGGFGKVKIDRRYADMSKTKGK